MAADLWSVSRFDRTRKTMTSKVRVYISRELLQEVDQVAGKQSRSDFVEAAVREKISRDALGAVLKKSAGILKSYDYPEWETPEKTSAWVRSLRQQDNESLQRKLDRSNG